MGNTKKYPTATTYRLQAALRQFTSPALTDLKGEQIGGNELPLDKKQLSLELVVVGAYFPTKMMIRGILRDTYMEGVPTEEIYAHVLVAEYNSTTNNSWIPSDAQSNMSTDSTTGWPVMTPTNNYMGVVEALKGDPQQDYIMLGYIHMPDEGDLRLPVS